MVEGRKQKQFAKLLFYTRVTAWVHLCLCHFYSIQMYQVLPTEETQETLPDHKEGSEVTLRLVEGSPGTLRTVQTLGASEGLQASPLKLGADSVIQQKTDSLLPGPGLRHCTRSTTGGVLQPAAKTGQGWGGDRKKTAASSAAKVPH